MHPKIFKVAAVVIKDNKFLMVRKTGKDIWTNLGGKPEVGESDEQALKREVKEELDCETVIIERIGEFENKAVFDDATIHISFFLTELVGSPRISDDELEEFKFISEADVKAGIKMPLTITEQLIPILIKNNMLSWEEK